MSFIITPLLDGVVDANGAVVALGRAYFFEPDSTTPVTVYADPDLATALPQGSLLDGGGRLTAYASSALRVRVEDDGGTVVMDALQVGVETVYADQVLLRNAPGYAGTGDYWTATNQDGVDRAFLASFGGKDAKYERTGTLIERNFKDKLGEEFDVQDFGTSMGGGSVEDTAAVRAAITAMGTRGGTLRFSGPGKTYIIAGTLTFNNLFYGVRVIADGGVVIRQSGTDFALFTITGTTQDVWFESLHLEGGGSALSTGSRAISVSSSTARVFVQNCHFTGEADGTGFNQAVYVDTSSYAFVSNCLFQRIYGTGSAGVIMNGVSFYCQIANNAFAMSDGIATKAVNAIGISTGGALFNDIGGNVITGASSHGISVTSELGMCVHDNRIGGCGGAGVAFVGSLLCKAQDNYISTCQDGVLAINSGVVSSQSHTISGNTIYAPTRYGVYLTGDASGYVTNAVVTGNNIELCEQIGIYAQVSNSSLIEGNIVSNCSHAASGTYPAIAVSTFEASSVHYGGSGNIVAGNRVAGTGHSAALQLLDALGGYQSMSTWVGNNSFARQANGITVTVPSTALQSANARMNDWDGTPGGGDRVPWIIQSGNASIDRAYSGRIYTNRGASGSVTWTLPLLVDGTQDNGLYYTIVLYTAQDIVISSQGSQAILRNGAGSATTVTLTAGANEWLVRIVAIGVAWFLEGGA